VPGGIFGKTGNSLIDLRPGNELVHSAASLLRTVRNVVGATG
jgi:hypothetical protein